MLKHTLLYLLLSGYCLNSWSQQQLSNIQHRTGAYTNPRAFQKLGNQLLFIADTFEYGTEWWSSDGTDAGTKLLKDISPGPTSSLVRNLNTFNLMEVELTITVANGLMYFLTKNALNQSEIWQTDGSTEGTRKLYTYEGIIGHFMPTLQGDKFYVLENSDLYFVDITAKTRRRVNTPGGSVILVLPDYQLTDDAPALLAYQLFYTYNVQGEYELWRTDGSVAGTERLSAHLIRLGQPLYTLFKGDIYVYNSQNDKVVIKTRGTAATTKVLIPPVTTFPSAAPERFRGMASRIVEDELQLIEFPNYKNTSSNQVLVRATADGQMFRTVLDKSLAVGKISGVQVVGNNLYYASQSDINTLDLTTGNTKKTPLDWFLSGVDYARVKKLSNNFLAYFVKSTDFRSQLYLFNTAAQTITNQGTYVVDVAWINNSLVLSGSTTAKGNVNLYRADLTGQNVKALGNLQQVGDNEIPQFKLGSQLYFIADNDGQGITLYKTDGVVGSQTVKVLTTSQNLLLNGAESGVLYSDGQRVLFSYADFNHNYYLWVTDGTANGTNVLGSITNALERPQAYSIGNQVMVWPGGTQFYKIDFTGLKIIQSTNLNLSGNRKTLVLDNRILLYDEQSLGVVDVDNKVNLLENRTLFNVDSTLSPQGIGARFFYLRRKTSGKIGVMTGAGTFDAPKELMELPSAKATFKASDGIFIHRNELNANGQINSFLTFVDANGQAAQEMGPFAFLEMRGVQKMGNVYALAVTTSPNRLNVAMLDIAAKSIRFLKGDAADSNPKWVMYGQGLYIISSNVWKVQPTKDSLSRLLPLKFYQNVRSFEQDKKLYVSYANPTPETWEIDSLNVRLLGNFFVTTRFTELLQKKAFQGYTQNSTGITNGIYVVESPSQTVLLKSLPPNRVVPEQWFSGMLIFTAESENAGNELWITEGTPQRTRQLADLREGSLSSNPKDFRIIEGNVFVCTAIVTNKGRQLWNVTPPVLAIEPPALPFSIQVFPNPVSEIVSLTATGNEKLPISLKMIDLQGRVVLERQLQSMEHTYKIDVSSLATGVYIVMVSDGRLWVSKKIIKY